MWLALVVAAAAAVVGLAMALRRAEQGRSLIGLPRKLDVAGAALFVVALSLEVYGIENTSHVNKGGVWGWFAGALLLLGYLGGGLVIGRWWAIALLPLVAILIALPAGENPAVEGDIPWVVFIYVFLLPIWMGLVAIGVISHKLIARFCARGPAEACLTTSAEPGRAGPH
jgi:hypothetical protein